MRRFSAVLIVVILGGTAQSSAQGHVSFGAAIGTQVYEQSDDKTRISFAADALLEISHFGVQPSVEYTNRSTLGRFTVLHVDAVYRLEFGELSILIGAGPTRINAEAGNLSRSTWNAEVEAALRFGPTEVLWRIRQYEYSFSRGEARFGKTRPETPAVFLGVRRRLK